MQSIPTSLTTRAPAGTAPPLRLITRIPTAAHYSTSKAPASAAKFLSVSKASASHVGGYDEFTIDITEAAARSVARPDAHGQVQLAVVCDNSRSLETIPSDQSDFNRYGGLYRNVNLVYAPPVSAGYSPFHPAKTTCAWSRERAAQRS